jgi:uncharacterized protein DUF3551
VTGGDRRAINLADASAMLASVTTLRSSTAIHAVETTVTTFCKISAAFAALAFAVMSVDAATAAPQGGPDQAYCLGATGGGSPWCGFSTYAQCEESASGTGADCVANVWRDERPTDRPHRRKG